MSTTTSTRPSSSILSPILISLITLLAIFLGLIVQSAAINLARPLERLGVSSSAPAGWYIRKGVAQEELLYAVISPSDPYLKYSISLTPATPGAVLTDAVVVQNMNRAQSLNAYKVLDQAQVKERGKDAYKVVFAYVQPNAAGALPVVVRGVDFYFAEGDQVMIVSLEEQSEHFEEALPGFMRFLASVKVAPGGAK